MDLGGFVGAIPECVYQRKKFPVVSNLKQQIKRSLKEVDRELFKHIFLKDQAKRETDNV